MIRVKKITALLICMVMVMLLIPGVPAGAFSARTSAPSTSSVYWYNSSYNPYYSTYTGQCTWYVWGRAYEITGTRPTWSPGNAYQIYSSAVSKGYSYGSTPKVGAIMCTSGGSTGNGHVAVVESISNGSMVVSEYNFNVSKGFGTRTLTVSAASAGMSIGTHTVQGYIYLADKNSVPSIWLDTITGGNGTLKVIGWAYDPDATSTAIEIHAYVGGSAGASGASGFVLGTTNVYRSDVNEAFGLTGNHGFEYTIELTDTGISGTKDVYLYAIDTGGGENGCTKSSATITKNSSPYGCFDSAYGYNGSIRVTGWACDPDSSSTSVGIHVYIGGPAGTGKHVGSTTANVYRSDVNEECNISGNHGFNLTVDLTSYSYTGSQSIYVYALDLSGRINTLLTNSPRTVTISSPYTVAYNANGGSGAPSTQKKAYGINLTLSSTKPTRTGYTFKNWNTASGGTGTSYSAGASYTANSSTTLYAQWTANTYTIAYNANGGSGAPSSQTKTYGTALTLSSTKPTRDGYTFKNWNTASGGTGTSYAAGASYTANAAATLYAQWTINTYEVTYNANGGSGAPSSQTKTYGTALTLSSTEPTRDGYTFKNWNTAADGSGTSYAAGASYTANAAVTLYAQWTANTYTITYNASGGSGAPSSQTKTHGTALTLSDTEPTRDGYTFKGWNTAADGSGTSYAAGASYTANAAATLYAQWTANTYTIAYNANGGSGAPSSQTKTHGTTLTLSSTEPTRDGYTFKGWNTAADGSGTSYAAGASYTANAAATLYAQWTANTYTITYNANGGSGAPSSQTETYGTALTLSSTVPTCDGYTFAGWNTAADGSGTSYAAGASYTANASVTLYAQWTANTYIIAYNANGGSGAPSSQTKTYGTALTLSSTKPTRDGYTFKNWNTSSDGSGTSYAAGASYTANAAVTLYAQWTINTYTITYDANGGSSAPSSQTKTYSTALKLSSTEPTRDGYTFIGWNTAEDGSGISYAAGAIYTVNAAVMLYAQWEEVHYPVESVTLDYKSLLLTKGGTAEITATVLPENASDKSVMWESSDESVATVTNGVVTAISIGSAVVTVTTSDGGYTAECSVKVGVGGTFGDLTWVLDLEEGTLTISGSGAMPSYLNASSVPWYDYIDSIQKAVIKYGVTSIGSYAFCNCGSMTSVTIPDSVTSVGASAFAGCGRLTSITIPNSVTSIGKMTFYDCSSLTNITLPERVTSISTYALFAGCSSLTSVTIPNNVAIIGERAFYGCSSLTSVTIPDSVTSIGESTFEECSSMTSITIPDTVTSIGSHAFGSCSSLTSITIPDEVTSIENYTFYKCSSLKSIAIPDSVTSIGSGAFAFCSSLTSVTIPDGVTSIDSYAFAFCSSLARTIIPDGVTSIEDYTFYGCSSMTSVIIPDGVTSIGSDAFGSCSSMTSVTIPNSVTSIGSDAFYNCSSLTSITIPNGVTCIGEWVFFSCRSLTSAAIPLSVTNIEKRAFSGCSNLASIYYEGSQEDWESVTVEENSGIESATVYYNMSGISDSESEDGLYDVNYIKSGTAASGEFYAEVSVTKSGTKSGADVVIAAAYKDGALVDVGSAEIQMSSGETTILQINLDADENCEIKAFIWYGFDTMVPLSNVKSKRAEAL